MVFIYFHSNMNRSDDKVQGQQLSRTTIVIWMMMILWLQFSYTISTSSDCVESVAGNKHPYDELIIIQPNDNMMLESNTISTSIAKWDQKDDHQHVTNRLFNNIVTNDDNPISTNIGKWDQKEDQHHVDNRLDDIVTNDDMLIHRIMNEADCITNEDGLRMAISNAPEHSLIATDIIVCADYIAINAEMNIIHKFIHFNCVLSTTTTEMKCTLDAQNKSRHFNIGSTSIISFQHMIFINGKRTGYIDNGGSILIKDAFTIEIMNCDFHNNELPYGNGGAIYISNSVIKMINVTMMNNKAYDGGAIYFDSSNANMKQTVHSNNIAYVNGGAIYSDESNVTIANVVLTSNKAQNGGAVYSNAGNLIVTDATVTNNNVTYRGGAFYSWSTQLIITNANLSNNNAKTYGGAINHGYSHVIVSNASLTNNNATWGGVASSGKSNLKVKNVIIANNNAMYGGVFWISDESDLLITNANLLNNYAMINGSILYSTFSYTTMTNSEAYSNGPKNVCEIYQENSRIEISDKIVEPSSCLFSPEVTPSSTQKPTILLQPTTPPQHSPTRQPSKYSPTCVTNEDELRMAISNAPDRSLVATDIILCTKHILINLEMTVLNKFIRFNCVLSNMTEKCTLDAQNKSRHFYIGSSSIISFQQIIFMNGYRTGYSDNGGSLLIYRAFTIEISHCDFNNNALKYGEGGAIYVYDSVIKIINVTMINNQAYDGGAIYFDYSNANMIQTVHSNNTAYVYGGAVYSYKSNVTVTNASLTNNKAQYGGAVHSSYGNLIVTDATVTNNKAASWGGALNLGYTQAIFTNSNLRNNNAMTYGGAFNYWNSRVIVTNASLTNNNATWGGVVTSGKSTSIIKNANIDDNNATYGGVFWITEESDLLISNTNLSNNNAMINGSFLYSKLSYTTMINSEAYSNGPKNVCEIYQENSRIEISDKIMELASCLVFPQVKPSSSKNPTILLQPTLPPRHSPTLQPTKYSATGCVTNETGLLSSIRNIPNNSLTPTNIKLCAKYIAINVNQPSGMARHSGINLVNKLVNFQCTLDNATEKCIIDAQKESRHFYLKNVTASFDRIIFLNGNVLEDFFNSGGSLWIELSTIKISECNFVGGTSVAGGAMYAQFSTIQMANVSFENNIGGAIKSGTSEVTIINGLLTNNSNNYGGAIDSYKSTITMRGVDLTNNIALEEGGAIKSERSVFDMTNVILANNSAIKDGGVISSLISNFTLTNVVVGNNNVKDGTIALLESNINLHKVSFAGADADTSDLLFGTYNTDDKELRYSRVNLPESPPPPRPTPSALYVISQILSKSACIYNCIALVDSINNCKRTSNRKPCRIYICSNNIQCSQTMFSQESPVEYGIDVSNKDIFFDCIPVSPAERCILDGSSNTRLFYGSNTNVEFNKIIFANGYDATSGGAMMIQNDSVVTLSDCTFFNCSAPCGAAVSLNNTQFLMEGTMSSIVNNTGNRASIEFLSSNVSIYNVLFAGNDIGFYGSEIIMFDSTISAANLSFDSDNKKDDCKVFVAMYRNDLTRKYSCIGMESINTSTPIVISRPSVTIAPTKAPIVAIPTAPTVAIPTAPTVAIPTAPTPAPKPGCFSARNKVQGIDGAYMRMDEVKIGNFIKSGNGEFTQIYGFGHMDPNKEAVFLQIYFGIIDRNQTDIVTEFSFIEISPMHLIFVDENNKKYPIRASDVVIGNTINGMDVIKIETVVRQGLYAPLTFSGYFIVNGVTVSNYVDVLDNDWIWNQHFVGHILFFPQRIICSCFMESCKREKYFDGYGYLAYVIVSGSSLFESGSFTVNNILLVTIVCIIYILQFIGIKKLYNSVAFNAFVCFKI